MAVLNRTPGMSDAAKYITSVTFYENQHFAQSASLSKEPAINELFEVWQDCKKPNWDGYDAFPVLEKTFRNARNVILALPLNIPLPSCGAECDGHLTLEWYRHPRCLLSVSVSPEGYLYYAALFNNESVKGKEYFDGEIPSILLKLIHRVYCQPS